MIAFLRFFHKGEMRIKRFFILKCHTINTGEHVVVFLSTPIRTGNSGEGKTFRVDIRALVHMRTGTEIDEITAFIHGQNASLLFIFINEFELIGIVAEKRARLIGRDFFFHKCHFFGNEFLHVFRKINK
jgi:hypothetical protein